MGHPYFEVPVPTVLGHRGAGGDAPENTLEAFERGLREGAHILESDVHATRDGVPVLIHDEVVDRVTEGAGRVADLDLEALRRLDAGHRWSPDGGASHPWRGRGLRIPTLEEALAAFPEARFNLEIKQTENGAVEATVDLVRRTKREERTLLTAGEDDVMARLREVLADSGARPALGASLADILAFIRSAAEGGAPGTDSMALQVPAAFGSDPLVTPRFVDHAHEQGLRVHVWTVNEEAEMTRLLDLGVDGLVTDHPARMADLLARRADG